MVIIRSAHKTGFDHIEVVLAEDNDKKITPKHVIFQLLFPIPKITQLWGGQRINIWKAEAAFRYHYIERYIQWVEKNLNSF